MIQLQWSTWSIDTVCPQTPVKLFADFNFALPTNYSVVWYKNYCGSPSNWDR